MSRIALGVSAGIAAYKACSLLRLFTESGHDVEVVPTANSLEFVGAATWAALSGRPVHTGVFEAPELVNHVRIGREADLVVVAPATADLIARAASGRADDLLTNVLLTARCPVMLAPAMHTEMWQHPATRANVATLRSRGVVVVPPAVGRLTGPDSGPGRLPEPDDLFATALGLLAEPSRAAALAGQDLLGLTVVVSAGGTHEALDPVRFLGNASSGRMGVGIARAAVQRGAEVVLVGAHLAVPPPAGVRLVEVGSTAELATAMAPLAQEADIVVMAAAPADFTPAHTSTTKLKKTGDQGLAVEFVQTTDVLAGLAAGRRRGQVVVGFAAETAADRNDLVALGVDKLRRKGCQLLVLNDVSGGAVFGASENSVAILGLDGVRATASGEKTSVGHAILDAALSVRKEESE
ncbi:MAG: bifunctional phosphopantothenoylcysteine decarboxylase/phosphopantothenate--cysteine ligase CoaBC [Propionibacteriaceae bacterium]|nr:bifunctional phosphopantothenoylcysteine decarboxylase/phosphopantothenate--cysteine ligase CoaBC [Propionibacteriaceae bacterium]